MILCEFTEFVEMYIIKIFKMHEKHLAYYLNKETKI